MSALFKKNKNKNNNYVFIELNRQVNSSQVTPALKYTKVMLYLQLFIDQGGENQSRAVTEFDCRGEVVSLEVFGVAWGSRHAHHLPPHQAVYN